MKLSEMIDRFISAVCAGKDNQTPAAYKTKLNHLALFLGNDQEIFNQAEIDQFRVYLLNRRTKRCGAQEIKGKLSKFTLRSVLATTRHFLKWSASQGFIPQGLKLEQIREPTPEPKAVIEITVELLLASAAKCGEAWEKARNTALIYVLRDTGARVGAIARIELDAMDLSRGVAIARDKNDQLAWLWFCPPTVAAICAWLKLRDQLKPVDNRLWTGARGKGITPVGIRHVLYRLAREGGITGRHNPHAFRHAFARDAILAGADIGQVSDMLGHSSIAVTHKYYARWTKIELQNFHNEYSPGKGLPVIGSAKP